MKKKLLKKENYAFIDSQNLNLGIKDQGWRLDFVKFRIYLKNKFRAKKAFLFICVYIEKNQKLYNFLKKKLGGLVIPNKYKYSSLLRTFRRYIDFLNLQKAVLERKKRHNPQPQRLRVASHRD